MISTASRARCYLITRGPAATRRRLREPAKIHRMGPEPSALPRADTVVQSTSEGVLDPLLSARPTDRTSTHSAGSRQRTEGPSPVSPSPVTWTPLALPRRRIAAWDVAGVALAAAAMLLATQIANE